MKITGLELFLVPPRWLFLKISTNSGISGWGEPVVEGHAETVRTLCGSRKSGKRSTGRAFIAEVQS
jgi:galactonate dehydratase